MGFDVTGIGAIADFAGKIVDKIFPDPAQKQQAQIALLQLQQTGQLAQLAADSNMAIAQAATNTEEAKSTNMFIAGWRPWIGWVCGLSLAYVGLIEPIARFCATVIWHYAGAFPVIDTSLTFQLMLGMLGLGGMRSFEKIKGGEANR